MAKLKQKQQRTQAVQGCNKNVPIRSTAPIVVPGCTFEFDSDAEVERYFNAGEGYLYSRSENPTVDQAAEEIAALEGAPAAAMFASGMAAISTAVLALAGKGGRVLCQREVYGGSAELMQEWLPRWGFEVQWIDREALNKLDASQLDGIALLYLETPTNPTLRLVDLEHVGKTARAAGVPTLVDSTFASPIVQRPLEFGIDLVMHSTTKYLGGHSDLLGGVICGDATLLQEVHSHRRILGGVMDAFSAFLLMRGLRTLPIRIAAHQ